MLIDFPLIVFTKQPVYFHLSLVFFTYTTGHPYRQYIVITKPAKGNGVAILDRKFYNNVTEKIISDSSKFEKLNEDPNLKREASLKRFLRKLKLKKHIDLCRTFLKF